MNRLVTVLGILSVVGTALAGTATPNDPTLGYYKIDVNWPTLPPVPVYVTNWPAVQAVSGSVNVGNLPAVQQVGGTVNVGNLPLTDDGALRVASAPARSMVWYELLDAPIVMNGQTDLPAVINSDGFSFVGVTVNRGDVSLPEIYTQVRWSWSDGEAFRPVNGVAPFQNINSLCGAWSSNGSLLCPNTGGRLKIHIDGNPGTTVNSVRVYLFP